MRDIGIENLKILTTLFSYLHFAFKKSLGHEESKTSAAVSVAAQKVTFSPSASMLRLFESAERMIRIAAEFVPVWSDFSELMPSGMGSFADLTPSCLLARVFPQSLCLLAWILLAWLMPFGMGKVNIANMTLLML